jgi:hypothetical protein
MNRYLGEMLTEEQIKKMMHCASVIHDTDSRHEFSPEEFYQITSRKRNL